ncbi:hypothetical protein RHMOL_Rhmol06G0155800 [Rhododendron molle]|uniref:Uncharacterized protein n=1 Tax=Rhododendron molle TaxID=49168 RepID=A0ACC0NDY1_RHOML|nr:hypothetical protein RHMOL_Rhmol06G0155800 [Rhododendron molle]
MDDSLVCNGFKKNFIYIHNQTIMHSLITHTISKPTLYNLHNGKYSLYNEESPERQKCRKPSFFRKAKTDVWGFCRW